jgi:hypothetical protein
LAVTTIVDHADVSSELHVGTRVTSHRRGNAIGIVKTPPSCDVHGGDRRSWVWVDYTSSSGAIAIDHVRDLQPVKEPSRNGAE